MTGKDGVLFHPLLHHLSYAFHPLLKDRERQQRPGLQRRSDDSSARAPQVQTARGLGANDCS